MIAAPLLVVTGTAATADDHRLAAFARWCGIEARVISSASAGGDATATAHGASAGGVAIAAQTLADLCRQHPDDPLARLDAGDAPVLVHHVGDAPWPAGLLEWLSDGRAAGALLPAGARSYRFAEEGRRVTRQLAGTTFVSECSGPSPVLDVRRGLTSADGYSELLSAGGYALFARFERGAREVFVLACAAVPDLQVSPAAHDVPERRLDQLVPLLAYMRSAFAERCWHAPAAEARVVVDDPLLDRRYGFLRYDEFATSMRDAGYGASMAFIPWNHWRTSKAHAARHFGGTTNLSVCVHGCDHVNREFANPEAEALRWRAATALRRMRRHEERTGLGFEEVMVFPQGQFSSGALLALRDSGYVAAVNSTCFPIGHDAGQLTMADLLAPAITRFHGFPVFPRRYPKRLVDSAFDLFIGRPALLVQHHDDFRNGYGALEAYVRGLRGCEPALRWSTLDQQLPRSCLVRRTGEHASEVRYFTRRFVLRNTAADRQTFRLVKHEPDPDRVQAVLVRGVEAPFRHGGQEVETEVGLDPHGEVTVEVVDRPPASARRPSMGVRYEVSVAMRRAMSEFRDNTLTRHPAALELAQRLARAARATGDG